MGRELARKHPRLRGLLLFALTARIFRGRQAGERHNLDRSQHLGPPFKQDCPSKVGPSMDAYAVATHRLEHGQLASFPQRRGRVPPAEAVGQYSIGRPAARDAQRWLGVDEDQWQGAGAPALTRRDDLRRADLIFGDRAPPACARRAHLHRAERTRNGTGAYIEFVQSLVQSLVRGWRRPVHVAGRDFSTCARSERQHGQGKHVRQHKPRARARLSARLNVTACRAEVGACRRGGVACVTAGVVGDGSAHKCWSPSREAVARQRLPSFW